MNKEILDFLRVYGSNEFEINRLIISAFLVKKNITNITNTKIQSLIIQKEELEYRSLSKFINIININHKSFCFEELLELFEFVISPSDKLVNGAIYTPKNIRQYITKESFELMGDKPLNNIKIADIACGCGGFLIDASKRLKKTIHKTYKEIYKDNIFGVDIQPYSVNRTEILLALLAISEGEDEIEFEFNIYAGDTLEFDWEDVKFDVILGNPPYVCSRNMDDKTKELMKAWTTCTTGHPDLYIPFFQIGYELLVKGGVLGYITVNSFINSVNGRAIRNYFEEKNTHLTIIDFGDEQLFKSRMTYTCLCFLQKNEDSGVQYIQQLSKKLIPLEKIKFKNEKYQDLNAFKGWNLKDNHFVQKTESRGTRFGDIYDTKSGIATLKNHVYIFKPINEDDRYYYIDEGIPIEKGICKDIVNSNKLDKYNTFNELVEKIIFPYTHDVEDKPKLIDEKTLKKQYPRAYQYLEQNKELLGTRDKGKGKYQSWYAFGRSQSLDKRKHKLLFPQLVKKGFKTVYSQDENLYFYNGMCAYASKKELLSLQKIMKTDEFWKYIENKAKRYASGYFGLGRNYLKDFGIIK